jgi:hypothetical protein
MTCTSSSPSPISDQKSKIKNPGGAPKGNLNALKHGFYTSRFKRDELSAADKVNPTSLTDEILFIRLLIRRLIDQADDNLTYQERCSAMRVFFLGCLALTRLFKVQQVLGKGNDQLSLDLDAAVANVTKEWHLDDPDYFDRNRPPDPDPATRNLAVHSDEYYQASYKLIEHLKKEISSLRAALSLAQDQINGSAQAQAQYSGQYSGQYSEPAQYSGPVQYSEPDY